jgi:hypothetical protein
LKGKICWENSTRVVQIPRYKGFIYLDF